MSDSTKGYLRKNSPYNASITREQFLFYEMRTTAKLKMDGLTDSEIMNRILDENLFQYPTEKSVRVIVQCCLRRLGYLNESLIGAIANESSVVAKQICLYAMMKQYRLVRDFMVEVIGEKYRTHNMSYGRIDMNTFFICLQEKDEGISTWTESTITKVKQVLNKLLVENEYIDSFNSDHLNTVFISLLLENEIRLCGDEAVLPAFNCFNQGEGNVDR